MINEIIKLVEVLFLLGAMSLASLFVTVFIMVIMEVLLEGFKHKND